MDLPEKVKVAGIDVKLIDWCPEEADEFGAYGIFSAGRSLIKVDTSKDEVKVIETLIHEVLHAICAGYHIREDDDEERTVSVMATGLTQVFRDSPELLDLIIEHLGDK